MVAESPVVLRPYQEEAITAIRGEWANGNKSTLLVMATGTGKTSVFGEIANRAIHNGKRVLVIAHREELIDQAAKRLTSMCGVTAEVEKAESHYTYESPLCIASVQSLQGKRLDALRDGWFDVLVIDEAHHSVASTYLNVIDKIGGYLLGVTATADRADKRGLAEVYDSIAYEYPLVKAVSDGYLCPIKAKCLPLKIDITNVKVNHGDYQVGELGSALDPYLPTIAETMAVECANRKTVCFLPLVSTAEKMADALNEAGISAIAASGYDSTADRAYKKEAFESGKYKVLCNSMLYTEGWDCPSVDCVVVLRPTKSRGLYCQMIGRGIRLSPGKTDLLLLDFLWMTEQHDLARPASLLGKSPSIANRMTKLMENGEVWDLGSCAEEAEKDVAEERERKLAEELEKMRKRKKKLVDPLQFAASIQDADLMDYQPTFMWESKAPTDKQIKTLEKFGIDGDVVKTQGQASALIDRCLKRVDSGLATAKQIRCLERYGFRHVGSWSMDSASKMISRIAINKWRVPRSIVPDEYVPNEVVW